MKRRDYLKLSGMSVVATTTGCVSTNGSNASETRVSFRRELQVKIETDVFIAGGGSAGLAAAVAAAESGARVFLVEAHSCFGGMGTAGYVPTFMKMSDGINFLAGGIGKRVVDNLKSERRIIGSATDIEALKRVYDNLVVKSGAKFNFYTKLVDVQAADGKIDYVVCSSPSELYAVRAKVYIDATGNGDLAVMAGANYEKGGENGMMPGTLCSLWGGIDWKAWNKSKPAVRQPQGYRLAEAFKDGIFTVKDLHMAGAFKFGESYGGGNIGHVFNLDGTDAESITTGLVAARKSMMEYERYLNNYLKGFENAKLLSTASLLGVRETRRITGEYVLNIEDYKKRATFDDEIGRYSYSIDIHPSDGSDEKALKKHLDEIYKTYHYKRGESYGIPYRILTPQGFDNMLVAGRCVSADQLVHGSIRVMPACFIMGQAAGIAAAQAASSGVSTRKIDILALQKRLKEFGAFLPNAKV